MLEGRSKFDYFKVIFSSINRTKLLARLVIARDVVIVTAASATVVLLALLEQLKPGLSLFTTSNVSDKPVKVLTVR